METVRGRCIVITGAESSLGRVMATVFAAEGMNVGLIGRNESDLEEVVDLVKPCGVRVSMVVADVLNFRQVTHAVGRIKDELGFIDTLINNAGAALLDDPESPGADCWEKLDRVNTLGLENVLHMVLPEMIREKRGDIINITPATDIRALQGITDSYTSKADLVQMSESLMRRVRSHNIRVTSLTPDIITAKLTNELGLMNRNTGYNMTMWFEDIAEEVLSQLRMSRQTASLGAAV